MAYECKVYDKNGKLKKILQGRELISKVSKDFFNQPSTKKAAIFIKKFKDSQNQVSHETKFHDKKCVVCGQEYYPRHAKSKYCSHECPKKAVLEEKEE